MSYPYPPTYTTYPTTTYNPITGQAVSTIPPVYTSAVPPYPPTYPYNPTYNPTYPYTPTYPARIY